MLKRKLQRLPFSEFAQISRAKRLKFSQKSADDTRFTQPGSQNAILERNAQIIINFLLDLSKGACRNCALTTAPPYTLKVYIKFVKYRLRVLIGLNTVNNCFTCEQLVRSHLTLWLIHGMWTLNFGVRN